MEPGKKNETNEALLECAYEIYNVFCALAKAKTSAEAAEKAFGKIYKGKAFDEPNMRKIHFLFGDVKRELDKMNDRVDEPCRKINVTISQILDKIKKEVDKKEGGKND